MISGSKGGSSKPYKPKEMADNLISINKIKVLLAVSDGEVDPEFSLKNLLLDDVPVQNQDGTFNYEGVTAEFRSGTQDQEYIQGFTETSNEITVAREIEVAKPFVISVTNKNLSAIRVKVLMPQGVTIEDDGDKVGVKVTYAIDMAIDGGSYKEVMSDTINGKTMSGYDRSRRVDLPKFNDQVLLRVRRVTPDSTSFNVVDKIRVQSYAEVVDAKFRYPLTGLVFVEFDSELFPNRIPNMSTLKKWKLINVPVNYDPETREYSGSWNGVFKKAWTNNPAWILYDLITNQRYGLDQRELGIEIDKWSIYEAAQYCDQKVPDGHGGLEPRYMCDVVIQSQIEAYQLVRDICSIFRGMSFWNGESLSIVIDKPRDPSYIFTNDNVVNGEFSYTFASEKSMYTACNVTFDDEQSLYNQDVEPVFDTEAAARFGYNPTSITAIGCTRRSEANRRGRWILKTNLRSTTVNFATGLEGMIPTIGDVIAIADSFWASNLTLNLSGRVMEVAGVQVFLPYRVDARAGDFIIINKPDGKPVKRTISRISPDGKTIELNVGFGFNVEPDTVFAIDRTDLALQQYVVTSINKGDGDEEFTYSITAVEYDPTKYDEIDYSVNIDDRPTSNVQPEIMQAPENVQITSYSRVLQGQSIETMHVSWDKVPFASMYEMQWRKGDGNWHNAPQTANKEVEIEGIYAGKYSVRVRSVSAAGSASPWSKIATASLSGKVGEPLTPINITASDDEVLGIRIKWAMPQGSDDTAYIEVQQAPDVNGQLPNPEQATLLSLVPYPQREYWHSPLPSTTVVWYRVRSVDRIGNASPWSDFVRGFVSDDVESILGDLKIDIEGSDGFQWLQENAISSNSKIHNAAEAAIENALASDADAKTMRKQYRKNKAEIKRSLQMIADETQARVEAMQQMTAVFDEKLTAQHTELVRVVANETEARTEAVNKLSASFDTSIKDVNGKITEVGKKVDANYQTLNTAIANEREARTKAIEQLKAQIGTDVQGQITTLQQAIAREEEARASADTALSARLGKNEAALNQKLDSWATAGSVGAMYGVKLGLRYNGVDYSAGMNMSLVGSGSNIKSQILFDASRLAVMAGSSGNYKYPFIIDNNQVVMDVALIKDGSINNAKIGSFIQSNNYIANQQGWRIDKNGKAEFRDAVVRGTVYATAGEFSGTIKSANGVFTGTVYAEHMVGDVTAAGVIGGWYTRDSVERTVTKHYRGGMNFETYLSVPAAQLVVDRRNISQSLAVLARIVIDGSTVFEATKVFSAGSSDSWSFGGGKMIAKGRTNVPIQIYVRTSNPIKADITLKDVSVFTFKANATQFY
ncbi:tail fiber protein [Hafnia phage Pocis76]|uniref:Tail fiber protein n=1 Tax=Hafnia phage Pocis76 TaxID=2831174 RepID=A0A8E7FNA0_9CAUD|nr:tail fiber protein [Hafnia phage Pocis76]